MNKNEHQVGQWRVEPFSDGCYWKITRASGLETIVSAGELDDLRRMLNEFVEVEGPERTGVIA